MSSSTTTAAKRTPVIEDANVRELLAQHAYLGAIETGEGENTRVRIRCELTQHELLPRKDAIEAHLQSKKFVKAKEWYCYDYSKYAPLIVPHRRKPKSLFCNVTHTVLNRIPAEVERHVNGKKFQRLKEHVKLTERKTKREHSDSADGDEQESKDDDENDFDANAFEFENAQVLLTDDEDEDGEGASSAKKSKAKASQSDAESDDEDDGDGDDNEDDDDDADDSDMAEFYPNDDDDDDGRLDHETVVKLAAQNAGAKKRKASDSDEKPDSAAAQANAPKKQKAAAAAPKKPKQASKARMSAKDRRQLKKPSVKK